MHLLNNVLLGLYIFGAVGLALYGINALWLTFLLLRAGRRALEDPPPPAPEAWPRVTVQLPIFNERHVVERLVDSVAAFDYPRDRLQIQLLDDSDDSTVALSEAAVARWQRRGVDIQLVTREERSGYKAGALAHALPAATGEFIAIFDADFLPPADFLRRALPHFTAHAPGKEGDRIAFVQARWDHLNRDYSLLTRCQALALDGHFGVEQPARFGAGYAFGFNGSAGVWRRSAIEDPAVGGWQADTLCEDLDLSYRAQLAGLRGVFVSAIPAPAEVPPQLLAFKRQQFRWAKGSVQTLVKLAAPVWRSGWPLPKRIAALLHLGNYLIHPLLLLLLLSALPMLLFGLRSPALLGALSVASLGPPLLYALAQQRLHPGRWLRHLAALPLLMLFGMGLCLSNSQAVWQGLRTRGGSFARTPKFSVEAQGDEWKRSAYRLPVSRQTLGEFFLALYALAGVAAALWRADPWSALFLALYAASFATMVGVQLWQARTSRPQQRPRRGLSSELGDQRTR